MLQLNFALLKSENSFKYKIKLKNYKHTKRHYENFQKFLSCHK